MAQVFPGDYAIADELFELFDLGKPALFGPGTRPCSAGTWVFASRQSCAVHCQSRGRSSPRDTAGRGHALTSEEVTGITFGPGPATEPEESVRGGSRRFW